MIHRFTVLRVTRWSENVYEGSIDGEVGGRPLCCYGMMSVWSDWDRVQPGATISARLILERHGEVRRPRVAAASLGQLAGVNYRVVGEVVAMEDEDDRWIVQSELQILLDLGVAASTAIPAVEVGDWVEVEGTLQLDIAQSTTAVADERVPTPFDALTPYDLALEQPQEPFGWHDYRRFITAYRRKRGQCGTIALGRGRVPRALQREVFVELPLDYRARLPVYELACCPICGARVWEPIDTFSLMGIGYWLDEPRGLGWFGRSGRAAGARDRQPRAGAGLQAGHSEVPAGSYHHACDCVRAVTYGVNLRGQAPSDVVNSGVVLGAEVPGLLAPFMAQTGSVAVLRTLSIGGWDRPCWEPRYTLYVVCYFNADVGSFRAALGDRDPSAATFAWPYADLSFELRGPMALGALRLHPTTTEAEVLDLAGHRGRAIIRNRTLHASEAATGRRRRP